MVGGWWRMCGVEDVWGGGGGECEVESPCVGVEGEEFLCRGGGGGVSMCGGKEVDFLWGGGRVWDEGACEGEGGCVYRRVMGVKLEAVKWVFICMWKYERISLRKYASVCISDCAVKSLSVYISVHPYHLQRHYHYHNRKYHKYHYHFNRRLIGF